MDGPHLLQAGLGVLLLALTLLPQLCRQTCAVQDASVVARSDNVMCLLSLSVVGLDLMT